MILHERNWRVGHLEIDLIMESNDLIHIIEVRSLQDAILVSPKETVIRKKQKRLIRAASAYVYKKNILKDVVFDIVSVIFKGDTYEIEYIEDAFLPLHD